MFLTSFWPKFDKLDMVWLLRAKLSGTEKSRITRTWMKITSGYTNYILSLKYNSRVSYIHNMNEMKRCPTNKNNSTWQSTHICKTITSIFWHSQSTVLEFYQLDVISYLLFDPRISTCFTWVNYIDTAILWIFIIKWNLSTIRKFHSHVK